MSAPSHTRCSSSLSRNRCASRHCRVNRGSARRTRRSRTPRTHAAPRREVSERSPPTAGAGALPRGSLDTSARSSALHRRSSSARDGRARRFGDPRRASATPPPTASADPPRGLADSRTNVRRRRCDSRATPADLGTELGLRWSRAGRRVGPASHALASQQVDGAIGSTAQIGSTACASRCASMNAPSRPPRSSSDWTKYARTFRRILLARRARDSALHGLQPMMSSAVSLGHCLGLAPPCRTERHSLLFAHTQVSWQLA